MTENAEKTLETRFGEYRSLLSMAYFIIEDEISGAKKVPNKTKLKFLEKLKEHGIPMVSD